MELESHLPSAHEADAQGHSITEEKGSEGDMELIPAPSCYDFFLHFHFITALVSDLLGAMG